MTTSAQMNTLTGPSYSHVRTLYGDILSEYDSRIRPRRNLSEYVDLYVRFSLISITDFDTAGQTISLMGYFQCLWVDELIAWNTTEYNGTQVIELPIEEVWVPDIEYGTAHGGKGNFFNSKGKISYNSDGSASSSSGGTYTVICNVNTKYYPFDKQTCTMIIYAGSLGSGVDLQILESGQSLSGYSENPEWKLLGVSFEKYIVGFNYIKITFDLERRTEFICYTVIAPLVLLSILNVGVFIVPVDSGEKGSIAVTVFLAYGVFVSMISNELPPHSVNVSFLLIYILNLLLLSVVAVIYSYIQSWIFSHYADKPVNFSIFKMCNCDTQVRPATKEDLQTKIVVHDAEGMNNSNRLTWRQVLRKMDIAVFLLMLLLLLICTSVSFAYMTLKEL